MDEKTTDLTNSEWEVCECLWERAPLTMTQIAHRLTERIGWSKSTGETMVRRMEKKALLRVEQGEKAKRFYPVVGREEAARRETQSFLDKVYGGRLGLMMSAMAESEELTQEQIAELYEILRRAEGRKNG